MVADLIEIRFHICLISKGSFVKIRNYICFFPFLNQPGFKLIGFIRRVYPLDAAIASFFDGIPDNEGGVVPPNDQQLPSPKATIDE